MARTMKVVSEISANRFSLGTTGQPKRHVAPFPKRASEIHPAQDLNPDGRSNNKPITDASCRMLEEKVPGDPRCIEIAERTGQCAFGTGT